MTNQEMLMAAIEFEEVDTAYDLLYLIQNGIIDGNAEYKELGQVWNQVDAAVTREWQNLNLLGFDISHLYGIRVNASDWMLILAKTDEQARGYALNKLGGGKVVKFPKEKKLTTFYFPDTKTYKTISEIEAESNIFPRMALLI